MQKRIFKITTEIYDTVEPTTSYVNDAALPKGTDVSVQQSRTGYKVRVHKKAIRSGKLINDEIISDDYYLPINAIIEKGTKS